ncbi:MAG: hypothetical protein DRH12_15370 [Deltaproteobacteria bacterium]|nr:MAG: hypothetical protein DRH12_15370 [Deltaproteobacteria bacterium]
MTQHLDRENVLFGEHHAAGQSLKNSWTRLASTYGCLRVTLSRNLLVIKPHWFAKWPIALLCMDLSHEIPIESISDVTEIGEWFNYTKVQVRFRSEGGEDKTILLYLKNGRDFVDKLQGLIQ